MSVRENTIKYGIFFLISLLICVGLFVSKRFWIPKKHTFEVISSDFFLTSGLNENFMDLQKKIKSNAYPLVDNVAYNLKTPGYGATIVKTPGTSQDVTYIKYRIMMTFVFPYTDIPRHEKIDAILVDLDPKQNQEFAELFWSIK